MVGLVSSGRFAFIHVMKAGGQSVATALQSEGQRLSELDGFAEFVMSNHAEWYRSVPNIGHASAYVVRDYLGEQEWASLFSFGIVRNPFDWLLSLYSYIREHEKHYQYNDVKPLSFEEFVEYEIETRGIRQIDFIAERSGEIIVSKVFRLESMNRELPSMLSPILGKPVALKKLNSSKHALYSETYSAKARRLVESAYKADLEKFGYSF